MNNKNQSSSFFPLMDSAQLVTALALSSVSGLTVFIGREVSSYWLGFLTDVVDWVLVSIGFHFGVPALIALFVSFVTWAINRKPQRKVFSYFFWIFWFLGTWGTFHFHFSG